MKLYDKVKLNKDVTVVFGGNLLYRQAVVMPEGTRGTVASKIQNVTGTFYELAFLDIPRAGIVVREEDLETIGIEECE